MRIPTLTTCVALAAIAGCTTQQPKATVSAAEASLAAAGKLAMSYLTLPVCGPTAPQVCGQVTIRAQMKTAYDAAYNAVTQAQATADAGGNPDMTAATAALQALQSMLTTYVPKQGA